MTRIAVADVRAVADRLLSHLESEGLAEFELTKDFYWSIPAERAYDPYGEPKELTLGQLTDDWAELKAVLGGSKEPVGYALVWLAGLLKYLGENVDR